MLLTPLLIGVLCLAEAVALSRSPFNFRECCQVRHLRSRYFATCDGSSKHITKKELFLDGRSTEHMTELNLLSFNSVTFDSTVQISKISIRNTTNVSLVINNSRLMQLSIDTVDELRLQYIAPDVKPMETLSLSNVNRLHLVSEGEFPWNARSITLNKVGDTDLGSSLLNISATNFTFKESNINLNHKSSLILKAVSAQMKSALMYIQENGSLKISADHFFIEDSILVVENGIIDLIHSEEVFFSRNSFYGFESTSLSVLGSTKIKFVENEIFTNNIVNVLRLNNANLTFINNSFGCNDCVMKKYLLGVDLKDLGDVNYCYSSCNLSLNIFTELLGRHLFCKEGDKMVNHTAICSENRNQKQTVSKFSVLQWCFIVIIPLILIVSLLVCIYYKNNRKKVKTTAITNVLPQELLHAKMQQERIAFSNDSYESVDFMSDDNFYELIDTPVTH